MPIKSKYRSLLLFVILTVASLLLIESANAQSIPKPSVPEFTVQFLDRSYDVPTTTSFDPYTGKEITDQGYHVENKTIEIKIKNQPFEPFYNANGQAINLYYNIRIKGYFEQNWTEVYRPVYGFPLQSTDSDYTVLSYTWVEQGETQIGSSMITLRNGAQADFQVEAMIGYIADSGPYSDRSPREYFEGETSGWSNTQSITIGEVSASISPSPTVPEFPIRVILPLFVIIPLITIFLVKKRICLKPYN
jgi:hypothetical protein